jgi:hypothetical protein
LFTTGEMPKNKIYASLLGESFPTLPSVRLGDTQSWRPHNNKKIKTNKQIHLKVKIKNKLTIKPSILIINFPSSFLLNQSCVKASLKSGQVFFKTNDKFR